MIPIYNDIHVTYTIEQQLALGGDVTAEPNTQYTSQGEHTIELPDVETSELGIVVILIQELGNGTVNDRTSQFGLTDEGGTLNTTLVTQGQTVGFFLRQSFGRRQWNQLSPMLFDQIADQSQVPIAYLHPNTIQEIFTVPDIASRDALVIGNSANEVSPGDVAVVLDYDGQGTKQNYMWFADTSWAVSTTLTEAYEETFFAANIAARDALPTGIGVNVVSIGDNVIVADGDGTGVKKIFQWGGDVEEYILVYSEDTANLEETFTVGTISERDALPLGPGATEVTTGDTVKVNDYDGYGNAAMYTYYTDSGYVLTSTYGHEAMQRVGDASNELTGFVDNDNIVSLYDPITRRVTMTHPSGKLEYLWNNTIRSFASPFVSNPHPDTPANFFLMSTDGETTVWSTEEWKFTYLQLAFASYDSVASIRVGVCEPHGLMPADTHRSDHYNIGTWREEGTGKITSGTIVLDDGDNDSSITPGVDECALNDEDIRTVLPALPEGIYTTHHLTGAGESVFTLSQAVPLRAGGSFMYANTVVNGVYADTPLANGQYTNIYCISIPMMADAGSQRYRFIWQVDQNIYSSAAAALAASPQDLNLGDIGILSNEFTVSFKLVVQAKNAHSSTGKIRIHEVVYFHGSKANLAFNQGSNELSEALYNIGDLSLEHTGFADNANIDVSYNKTTRVITLTHPSGVLTYMWRNQVKYLASPWSSDPHVDAVGQYFLRSDDGILFSWTTDHEPFSVLHVGYVNYNGIPGNAGCIREVHGFMPHHTHRELHYLMGTWKEEGTGLLTAATYAINPASPVDADNTPGVDETVLVDEDLPTTLPAIAEGTYMLHHLNGAASSNLTAGSVLPFRVVPSGAIIANTFDGVNYVDTEVSQGKWVNVYCIGLPMASDVDSQAHRYVWFTGHNIYSALELAQAEQPRQLSLGQFGGFAIEHSVLFKITYRVHSAYTTTGKCRIEHVEYYTGSQASLLSSTGGVLAAHKHEANDILGYPVLNGGTAQVPHGYCVQRDGSGNYRLAADSTWAFVGINTNNTANAGDQMHLKAEGLTEAIVETGITPGTPLRPSIINGKLVERDAGDELGPVVGFLLEYIDGETALVHLVMPFTPKTFLWQLTSMGVVTPGSLNVLGDDYEGGKLIYAGPPAYLLKARIKYRIPDSSGFPLFDIYRNDDIAYLFSNYAVASANADTFGAWAIDPASGQEFTLFNKDDHIRLTEEDGGVPDGEDLTIQFVFEEKATMIPYSAGNTWPQL